MSDINPVSVATAAIAIYGAGLATAAMLSQRRRDSVGVSVSINFGMPTHGAKMGDPVLVVSAANSGFRPVTLHLGGLKLPDGRTVVLPETTPPAQRLEAGDPPIQVYWPLRQLARNLHADGMTGRVPLVAIFVDQAGTDYPSKPYRLDVDDWGVLKGTQ